MRFFQYGELETAYLAAHDPELGAAMRRLGHIEREVYSDVFSMLVNAIVGQQISRNAKEAVWRRMIDMLGNDVTPASLGGVTRDELRGVGLSYRKADYIIEAARRVRSGELDLRGIAGMSNEDVCRELCALPGVGVWTAEMLMLFALQHRDVLSYGDLGIRLGICRLHGMEAIGRGEFELYRALYSPYGSTASIYLWAVASENEASVQRRPTAKPARETP